MSLVNDVLRQLDSEGLKPKKVLPLHPLMADNDKPQNSIFRILFFLIIFFLLLVLALQSLYKESIIELLGFNNVSNSRAVEISVPVLPFIQETELNEDVLLNQNVITQIVKSSKEEIALVDKVKPVEKISSVEKINVQTKSVTKETAPIATTMMSSMDEPANDVVVKNNSIRAVPNEPPVSVKGINVLQPEVEEKLFQPARIETVENLGFKKYQLALRAYKHKQNAVALELVDDAISEQKKDEYLRLKVRVLSQQGSSEALRQFILDNNDNTSLSWFQLVAPSLQMHAYYELSNVYYAELVNQQPNEVKWQLAMALNYSKLGLEEKTYLTYKRILDSSLLTYKQKKWVASRLERMQKDGGIRSEN